jgi:hypothetical protein
MDTATTHTINNFSSVFTDDISLLEKNTEEHPESSIARFMLLRYYKKNNNPAFENLAKQTALYFSNPNWLQFQLSQIELREKDHSQEPATAADSVIPEESEINESGIEDVKEFDEERKSAFQKPDEAIEVENEEVIPSELEKAEKTTQLEDQEEISKIENEEVSKKVNHSESENIEEAIDVENEGEINKIESQKESEETNQSNVEIQIDDGIPQTEEIPAFEPLHTVDYFASQGIKIKEEALMNDKLGKQMKSFTDWLKSMKKLHPGKLPEQNEVIERIIQASAEESNADAEILTEAMAEVLLKQNKREKAIAMYQKLSLINPSKSAYFASRIESIKNQ